MQRRVGWELKPLPPLSSAGGPYTVTADGLTLGRGADSSLSIDGEVFPGVSGLHARVSLDPGSESGGLWVEDLGSRNGTLVNGHRVERAPLANGSVVELGAGGPRFVVVAQAGLAQTTAVPRPALGSGSAVWSLGATAMLSVKKALGLDRGAVEELVATSQKRSSRTLGLVTLLILTLVAGGFWLVRERGRAELDRLRAENDELRATFEEKLAANRELADALRERVAVTGQERAAERAQFDTFLDGLRLERAALEERFARLETKDTNSASELGVLRGQLDETSRQLALFDPVMLNEAKLSDVGHARSAVCLIEVELTWREQQTEATLFLESDTQGSIRLNLEDRGTPFSQESTGSGFCVSPEGWIVTNAHVVEADEEVEPLEIDDMLLVPYITLHVVFSGQETRHVAQVWEVAFDERDDLALIKIEPFEGLAYLEDFDVHVERPAEGSEVFLLGFPLGTHALQEGDKVIASTFKGILSRFVEPYFQVDAGVHPGNSGGPIVDARGRVLGVVTAGQITPEDGMVYTIGYAIPVDRVERIWPPTSEPRGFADAAR